MFVLVVTAAAVIRFSCNGIRFLVLVTGTFAAAILHSSGRRRNGNYPVFATAAFRRTKTLDAFLRTVLVLGVDVALGIFVGNLEMGAATGGFRANGGASFSCCTSKSISKENRDGRVSSCMSGADHAHGKRNEEIGCRWTTTTATSLCDIDMEESIPPRRGKPHTAHVATKKR